MPPAADASAAAAPDVLEFEVHTDHTSWEALLTAADRWAQQNESTQSVQLKRLKLRFIGPDTDGYGEFYLGANGVRTWQEQSDRAAATLPRALAALAAVTELEADVIWNVYGTSSDCSCVLLTQLLQWCPKLKAQHCIMCTGYTRQIAFQEAGPDDKEAAAGPSRGPSQFFFQASGGTARLVCGEDRFGAEYGLERWVFPGVDDAEVELARDLLERSPAALRHGTFVVRDDGAHHDPFRVLRTFLRVFNTNATYGYCGCLHFPDTMKVHQDPACGGVAAFTFDCEAG